LGKNGKITAFSSHSYLLLFKLAAPLLQIIKNYWSVMCTRPSKPRSGLRPRCWPMKLRHLPIFPRRDWDQGIQTEVKLRHPRPEARPRLRHFIKQKLHYPDLIKS